MVRCGRLANAIVVHGNHAHVVARRCGGAPCTLAPAVGCVYADHMRSWNLGLVAWLALSASVSLLSQKPQGVGADGPWRIPVLVVNYLPRTADGLRIDIAVTSNVDAPVTEIEEKCRRQTAETIEALEQGSRFRAYKNPEAKPSLDYEVVHTETFYEAMPHDAKHPGYADYNAMLARIDVATWVEKKGVREIWFWGYHSKQIAPNESNMAGPHGDVSNSYRHEDDLPRLSKTYTVYHYNYERDTAMAVHNHLHQIEALMRAHGGELWQLFEGKAGAWRCGNCHFPPNARFDYDWRN